MTKDNLSCRPGTTDAMQRLADENEALQAERDELAARVDKLRKRMVSIREMSMDNPVDTPILRESVNALAETPVESLAHIRAAGARELLERAMQPRGFSDTVVRVDLMREIIEQMESE